MPSNHARPHESAPGSHYVYLYRSTSGKPKYVGYGASAERAISHAGASHNPALRTWLGNGSFDLSVAGPYRDEAEGRTVEAALISALQPEFNRVPGTGPKFAPLGVPPEFAERPTQQPLDLATIGRLTGGALLVYLAPGDLLVDGRPKFDPAHPDDRVIVSNIEGVWDIGRHREAWEELDAPKVLVGVHGRPKHRFIAGSALIDQERWFDGSLEIPGRRRWKVPLLAEPDLDAFELRGRRLDGVLFGQFNWQLHIWVDRDGVVRHPA